MKIGPALFYPNSSQTDKQTKQNKINVETKECQTGVHHQQNSRNTDPLYWMMTVLSNHSHRRQTTNVTKQSQNQVFCLGLEEVHV